MSASHGYSTIGGIVYDDGGYVRKNRESLILTWLINGLLRCPSIDVNVRSWDCHGTIKNYRYDGDVSASPSLIPAHPRVGK